GLFFERRSTRMARSHARELERELRDLRESVYSVGMTGTGQESRTYHSVQDLSNRLMDWVRQHQDASGCLRVHFLVTQFVNDGFTRHEIDQVVDELCQSGRLRRRDQMLELI